MEQLLSSICEALASIPDIEKNKNLVYPACLMSLYLVFCEHLLPAYTYLMRISSLSIICPFLNVFLWNKNVLLLAAHLYLKTS